MIINQDYLSSKVVLIFSKQKFCISRQVSVEKQFYFSTPDLTTDNGIHVQKQILHIVLTKLYKPHLDANYYVFLIGDKLKRRTAETIGQQLKTCSIIQPAKVLKKQKNLSKCCL